ncbi:MAG: hypothetical protein LBH03_07460 [Holophagales bacterium]|nr:hypothetical protein [Holophagales bacterium]
MKFLDEIEQWIQEQEIAYGINFSDARSGVAITRISYLIVSKKYTEVEVYLRNLPLKFASEWPTYSDKIKNSVFRRL